ncbi:alkylmercury lyase [Tomitella biformata]|uniref:alkylmercury lyase n=1 Tax=Tomitella biformata TaxID=630403 RepID=UPI000466529E|nr:alkylmercury lyase [Tomitella biformata]
MKVEILYFDGCPNWQDAGTRVRAAAESVGLSDVEIGYRRIETETEAASLPFAGSPTILIDGTDAFAGAEPVAEFACRIYSTAAGLAGSPTVDQLAQVLRDRR